MISTFTRAKGVQTHPNAQLSQSDVEKYRSLGDLNEILSVIGKTYVPLCVSLVRRKCYYAKEYTASKHVHQDPLLPAQLLRISKQPTPHCELW